MARLVYSVNVTLDGRCDHTQAVEDNEHHDYALNLLSGATAPVLGRNTYELFESYWPNVARNASGPRSVVALARRLAELNEIEEYHFVIQPMIAGRGPRIFERSRAHRRGHGRSGMRGSFPWKEDS